LIPRESINDEIVLKIIDEKILSSPEFASINKQDLFEKSPDYGECNSGEGGLQLRSFLDHVYLQKYQALVV
jgi:hypothetical protein